MSHILIYQHLSDSITWDSEAQTFRARFSRGENESPIDVTFRANEMATMAAFHSRVITLEEQNARS